MKTVTLGEVNEFAGGRMNSGAAVLIRVGLIARVLLLAAALLGSSCGTLTGGSQTGSILGIAQEFRVLTLDSDLLDLGHEPSLLSWGTLEDPLTALLCSLQMLAIVITLYILYIYSISE